jgi:hypothetical protein
MPTTSASRLPGEEPTRDPRYCAGAMRGVLLQAEAAEQFRGRISGAFTRNHVSVADVWSAGGRCAGRPARRSAGSDSPGEHACPRHRTGVAWCDKQQLRP